MSVRTVAVEGPSDTAIQTALEAIQTELHGHFWVQDVINKRPYGTPPTNEELAALLDHYVRPVLSQSYYESTEAGDERDDYTSLDMLTQVYMAIGYMCAVIGFPPLDNMRQLTGLRHSLECILRVEWVSAP